MTERENMLRNYRYVMQFMVNAKDCDDYIAGLFISIQAQMIANAKKAIVNASKNSQTIDHEPLIDLMIDTLRKCIEDLHSIKFQAEGTLQ